MSGHYIESVVQSYCSNSNQHYVIKFVSDLW